MTTMVERPRAIESSAPEGFEDLLRIVEELDVPGHKAELIRGKIVVSPWSQVWYALSMELMMEALREQAPDGHAVSTTPILFAFPHAKRAYGPDLWVADRSALRVPGRHADGAALSLVAELTSVSTRDVDWEEKRAVYGRQVPVYLLLDMPVKEITVFSEPSQKGYQAHRTVRFGKTLWIPEPFGFDLDTTGLAPDNAEG